MREMQEAPLPQDFLLEELQRQQRQVQDTLERVEGLVRDLDEVLRQELRGAFAEEFHMLGDASARAAQALYAVRRAASMRVALWAIGVTAACSAVPATVAWTVLPSRGQIARLRHEREVLAASVARLEEEGGRVELRRCGSSSRLCVRVERAGPAYGAHADYLIVKGY
jgi:cell division FtsZ-interacting protein ZapD